MANNTSNVRFYKLPVLPSFDAAKHTGIFVHVTETMRNEPWEITGKTEIDPSTIFMGPVKQEQGRLNLVGWLEARRISQVESGLWFGGENGWELLSNEISGGGFAENGQLQINSNSVFTANQAGSSNIVLDANALSFNSETNTISVVANTAVAANNKLATMADIAGIAGAMHYKGGLAADTNWPSTVAAGDVYIVTTAFTHSSDALEVGDMIVFNSTTTSDYKVVQSNLTLGVGQGQVAANTEALADGKLVVGVNPATGSKGIKTVDFDVTNLTGTTGKNERTLSVASQNPDNELQGDGNPYMEGLTHGVGITDTFTIMGRNMTKSFSISSPNRSISIEATGTDAQVDLIWNTEMDA
jgi:hypothetical protein